MSRQIQQYDTRLVLLFLVILSCVYSFMSITLHNHFMTFALDTGVFDEWMWKISTGRFPYSGVGCNWILEDHFQVNLVLLSVLFWVWDNVRILFIAQAFAMVMTGYPLYLLMKKVTGHLLFSFSILFAYVLFIGTQFAILNEFHQITFAPLFITLLYLGLHKNSSKLYWFSIGMLLITKEDLSLLVAAIGLGLMTRKKFRGVGASTAFLGIGFFFFLVYFFMPSISYKGVYDHFHFGPIGKSPTEIVFNVITNPPLFLETITTPPIKVETFFRSLFTFSFLPLFSPLFYLIPLLEDFITRFIYSGPQYTKWGLVNHHSAVSAIYLAITSGYGAKKILMRAKDKNHSYFYSWFALLIFSSAFLSHIVYHGPLNSLFKPQFYQDEQWMRDNRYILSKVSPTAYVATQNNLAPHLTHREKIYRLPYGLNAEYIVVDLHDGPNKYAPLTHTEMKDFVNNLLSSKRFSIVEKRGEAMLLKRNYKTDITKGKYYNNTNYCYYSWEEL